MLCKLFLQFLLLRSEIVYQLPHLRNFVFLIPDGCIPLSYLCLQTPDIQLQLINYFFCLERTLLQLVNFPVFSENDLLKYVSFLLEQ